MLAWPPLQLLRARRRAQKLQQAWVGGTSLPTQALLVACGPRAAAALHTLTQHMETIRWANSQGTLAMQLLTWAQA